jgi:hypothetical protein
MLNDALSSSGTGMGLVALLLISVLVFGLVLGLQGRRDACRMAPLLLVRRMMGMMPGRWMRILLYLGWVLMETFKLGELLSFHPSIWVMGKLI